MGKKYLDTKENSIESAVMQVWQEAAKLDEYQKINGQFKKVAGGDQRRTENKMKTEKKLDPVGKADADIDNDGDVDSSDKYLKKRRAAIGKAMKKEGLEDSPNVANSQHLCAKNVVHEEWGEGQPVHSMHAIPDADGNIAWYDVMFEHGIEKGVSINELKVRAAESHHDHGGKKKKNEGAMKRGRKDMDTFKPKPQNEGTKQVLAHGGKGKYKVTKDGDTIEIKFGGKVVGTADFDRGADSFFVSMKDQKGQKSFDDAQAIADYFAKNKITEELKMRDFNEYQNFKVQSMRDAMEQVWATSAKDKLFEDINLMTEEQYDKFIDSLNEEELDELLGMGAASQRKRAEKKLAKVQTRVADKAAAADAKQKTKELKRANPGAVRKTAKAVGAGAKKAGGVAKKVGGGIASLAKKAGAAIMS